MTDFEDNINEGKVIKTSLNKIRASSLFKFSFQSFETAKIIPLNSNTSKTIFRELYESLREFCEGIGYLKGYKFLDHESIGFFLKDILNENNIYKKFDRYRKLINGINYYGEDIDLETVKEAIEEVSLLLKRLERYSK